VRASVGCRWCRAVARDLEVERHIVGGLGGEDWVVGGVGCGGPDDVAPRRSKGSKGCVRVVQKIISDLCKVMSLWGSSGNGNDVHCKRR
jgi:hypothetical protein